MINFTWLISTFECTPEKVVTSINWVYRGENENGTKFEMFDNLKVPDPNPDDFTDFENLTYQQVCSWIENLVDVNAMHTNITEQIELLEQPKLITLTPPF
jgi:hypothetical protein